ncbi:hypothetical protein PFBG_02004 [Plasmodium falciparum 7G8]|uniref:Uncharacterized protein n=1 Tax=Plasmodium falciparum (isolate 7G8) TaxID=57266 RepID=W7F3K7_PLAF8|nr:hypothetical protein PFBG_02004 [Plasmodium falciparum 7G8]
MYEYKKNNCNIKDKKIIQTIKSCTINLKVEEQGLNPKKKVIRKIKNDEEGKVKKGTLNRIKSNDKIMVVDKVRKKKEDTNKYMNKCMNKYVNKGINKDINKGINKDINKGINKDINIDKDIERKKEVKRLIKYKTPRALNPKHSKVMKLLNYRSCMEQKNTINKNNVVNNPIYDDVYKYHPLCHNIRRDAYKKYACCKVGDKNDKTFSNLFLLNNNISINKKKIGGMDIKKKKIIKNLQVCNDAMDVNMNNYDNQMEGNNNNINHNINHHSNNHNINHHSNNHNINHHSNNHNINHHSNSKKDVPILSISNYKEKYTCANKYLCLQKSNISFNELNDEKKKIKNIKNNIVNNKEEQNNIINDYIKNESHNINNMNLKKKKQLLYKKNVINRNKSCNSKYVTKNKLIYNQKKNMDPHRTINRKCSCTNIIKENIMKQKDKDCVKKMKDRSMQHTLSNICVHTNEKYKNRKKNNLFMDKIKKKKLKSKNDDIIKLWIAHKRNELIIPYHEKCITNCYTREIIKNKEIKNEHIDRNNVFNNYLLTIEGRKREMKYKKKSEVKYKRKSKTKYRQKSKTKYRQKSKVKYRRKNNQDQNVSTNKNIISLTEDEQNIYPFNKCNIKKIEKEYDRYILKMNKHKEELEYDKNNNTFKENHSFDKKLFMSNDNHYYDDKENFHNNIKNKRRCVSLNNINEPKIYNPLFITNDFRLKICYSNNFMDYTKIYNNNNNNDDDNDNDNDIFIKKTGITSLEA